MNKPTEMHSDGGSLLSERRDGVLIVTLNRPEKLNAITRAMRGGLGRAVEQLRDDPTLRVLLIQAAGRYFTAGADLKEGLSVGGGSAHALSTIRRDYRADHLLHDEMEAVEKPIVAAIQGPCLGLGVEMISSCDFRIASEDAAFGLPEGQLGWIAGSGGTSRFTRLCGVGWSKWLGMAGERLDARSALNAGFVQAVHPPETFHAEVSAFCQRLASRPAEAMGCAKVAIDLCHDLDRDNGRRVERLVNSPLISADNSQLLAAVMGGLRRGANSD